MTRLSAAASRRVVADDRGFLAAPTYLVAFALACIPPFDAAMQLMPFRVGQARWRFGAFGLASNAFMLTLAGFLVAFVASAVFGHRRTHRLLGYLALLGAVLTTAGLVIFGLDMLQVQRDVTLAAHLAFRVASITAAAKAGLAILTLFASARAAPRGGVHTTTRVRPETESLLIAAPTRAKRVV